MDAKRFISITILTLLFSNNPISAQKTDSLPTQKTKSPQYLRLNIENDMLISRNKTDRYFSSGVKLDYFFLKNPNRAIGIQKIFPRMKGGELYMGVSFMSNMYTPANLGEKMVAGDRPYAGWVCLGITGIANDPVKAVRMTTEYSLGAIGPVTQQGKLQTSFHKLISRPEPKGWDNQIANDIAANANIVIEKRMMNPTENVDVIGFFETNAGTVTNYMGVGGMVKLGWFDDYFKNIMPVKGKDNWQLYVFTRPVVRIVADNSLLEGGLTSFSRSPYVIARDDVNHFYVEAQFGYGLTYRNFNLTYSQSVRTPEFKDAKTMFWGGISMSVSL